MWPLERTVLPQTCQITTEGATMCVYVIRLSYRLQEIHWNLLQGLPQRAVISPLLFLLYIDGLVSVVPDAAWEGPFAEFPWFPSLRLLPPGPKLRDALQHFHPLRYPTTVIHNRTNVNIILFHITLTICCYWGLLWYNLPLNTVINPKTCKIR